MELCFCHLYFVGIFKFHLILLSFYITRSHNFRPSYLRLRASLLRTKLNMKCILAMTATATYETLDSIMRSLEISPNNLIKTSQIRANLQLSVSSSENRYMVMLICEQSVSWSLGFSEIAIRLKCRLKDLLVLLKNSPFVDMKSIIVYCKFQVRLLFMLTHIV